MSRSGYSDDGCDGYFELGRWRGRVASAIRGFRGQAFLHELALAMDMMPVKELIADELIDKSGNVCAIGVICKSRGIDVSKIDYEDPGAVANAVGIAMPMVAEIEYENDGDDLRRNETPADRWQRMRKWVDSQIRKEAKRASQRP